MKDNEVGPVWSLHWNHEWSIVHLCFNPSAILHFKQSLQSYLKGCPDSRQVPHSSDPGDNILSKSYSHNHIGYVWLIPLFLGAFCKWDYSLIPIWKGVISVDSTLQVVLSSTITRLCLVLTVPCFFWHRVLIEIPLHIWALQWSLSVQSLTAFLAIPAEMSYADSGPMKGHLDPNLAN
jgi:ABC-type anion transport system duplicated permease subunit